MKASSHLNHSDCRLGTQSCNSLLRSHSKITPFRWSVAFYCRAEGHSYSQTYRRLQTYKSHSSIEAIMLVEGGWTKLCKVHCGRYRLEMLHKRSSSSALKNTCWCHMGHSVFRKQHDYTDSRCSHPLNKTLIILKSCNGRITKFPKCSMTVRIRVFFFYFIMYHLFCANGTLHEKENVESSNMLCIEITCIATSCF